MRAARAGETTATAIAVSDAPRLRRKAVGILPPGLPGYSPDQKARSYDPGRARALLAMAGKPG